MKWKLKSITIRQQEAGITKPAMPVTFIVIGQPLTALNQDGKLEPKNVPPVRVEQIDASAEIGRQAWIAGTVYIGAGNSEIGMG